MSSRRTALLVVAFALAIMFGFSSGLPISPSVGRAQSGGPVHIQYNDFATIAGLVLNGTTAQSGNVLRLTPAAQFSAGSVFYGAQAIDTTQSFHTSFAFLLHDTNTAQHADGITFTIQSDGTNAVGGTGGGLGYTGLSPSVAVEFDTFKDPSDPDNNHVGIDRDGRIPSLLTASPSFDLYGAPVNAWVDYDATTKTLQVFVSQGASKPASPLLTTTIDIASIAGSTAWFGFTGGTGTNDEVNDLLRWELSGTAGLPPATATPAPPPTVITVVNGYCLASPYNTVVPCSPLSSSTPTATRGLISPTKLMSVGAPVTNTSGVSTYPVTITSSIACFPLDEPINAYLLGSPGAAVLHQVVPAPSNVGIGNFVPVTVDPTTRTAQLQLEVANRYLAASGLALKAVWPEENIERIASVIASTEPTPTPPSSTGAIATSTATATATAEATATGTPQPTTPTPTPTSTPDTRAFFLRVCATPNPVANGGSTTIFAQTLPGAVCVARVRYANGTGPTSSQFSGAAQTALQDGFTIFPLTVNTTATSGEASVACTLGGRTIIATTTLTIGQPTTPTATASTP